MSLAGPKGLLLYLFSATVTVQAFTQTGAGFNLSFAFVVIFSIHLKVFGLCLTFYGS